MRAEATLDDGSRGWTRDVSAAGIFIELDRPARVGDPLAFSMRLEHVDTRGPVSLTCEGTVVRVEPHGDSVGVGVALASFRV